MFVKYICLKSIKCRTIVDLLNKMITDFKVALVTARDGNDNAFPPLTKLIYL